VVFSCRGSSWQVHRLPVLALALALVGLADHASAEVTKYVRYSHGGRISYGVLEGESVRQLSGDLFDAPTLTGSVHKLAEVELLAPVSPSKVIAVGLNYKSHLGERPSAEYPGLFAKLPTSIIGHGADIVLPTDATNVHYEGEMVVVIGKRARDVSVAEAPAHVFGVTAGTT